jgi:hypothetical protein
MRPEWGAMHGKNAVSEQGLLEKAISRLPEGSTVMGDANFGVFSVAWAGTQNRHPVLLRLTLEPARRLAGEALRDGIDRPSVWKPSVADRRSHLELPADATVSGRLIVRQVQPGNGADPFLLRFQARVSRFRVLRSGILRTPRHCRAKMPISISARLSQFP